MPNERSSRTSASELQRLSEAASAGEWGVFNGRKTLEIGYAENLGTRPCIVGWPGFDSTDKPMRENRANAAFIVALVNAYRAGELTFSESTPALPAWVEEELKDGDRICEAAGVQRTEGGRLPVAKIVNAIKGRPVVPHRSGGSQGGSGERPSGG